MKGKVECQKRTPLLLSKNKGAKGKSVTGQPSQPLKIAATNNQTESKNMKTDEEIKDQKARQQLRDARCHRRYDQPQPVPVLHPQILSLVNRLSPIKRMQFLKSLHGIESLYPIGESRNKAIHSLLESLFIDKQTIRSAETIVSKEETERIQ